MTLKIVFETEQLGLHKRTLKIVFEPEQLGLHKR